MCSWARASNTLIGTSTTEGRISSTVCGRGTGGEWVEARAVSRQCHRHWLYVYKPTHQLRRISSVCSSNNYHNANRMLFGIIPNWRSLVSQVAPELLR